jgi:hypothetical protein
MLRGVINLCLLAVFGRTAATAVETIPLAGD